MPLTFKSYNRLNDIFNKYKAETNNKYKNLKFVFKIREFTNDDLNLYLGHIKGMATGEEIIVIGWIVNEIIFIFLFKIRNKIF